MYQTPFVHHRDAQSLELPPVPVLPSDPDADPVFLVRPPNEKTINCAHYAYLVIIASRDTTLLPWWWNPVDEVWFRDSNTLVFGEGGGIQRIEVLSTFCYLQVSIADEIGVAPDDADLPGTPVRLCTSMQRLTGN